MIKNLLFSIFILISFNIYSQHDLGRHYTGPSLGLSFLGNTIQLGANYEYLFELRNFGKVGTGAIFKYWSYEDSYQSGSWKFKEYIFAGQFNIHLQFDDPKFDPYVGLMLGVNGGSVSLQGQNNPGYIEPTRGGMLLAFSGGLRYWLDPRLSLNSRIAYGNLNYGHFDIGLDIKI